MAGFPPRFGTGMSPMGGLQPTNPTPTLPPLQTPAGNTAPPVGAPIPLSTGKTPGVVGYGGSSAGRDNFSKYLQKMNTSAPLAMNRGGPVKMREGGMVQQQGFLPPMNLSAARPALFGGTMHMGPTIGGLGGGGISGALEPLKNYITTQVQQQNNEKIGPFVDGIVQNVEQEFGLQSGGMTAQPAITQMPSMNRPSLGLGYGNFPMPALNRVPFFGGFQDTRITPRGGFDSPFRGRALGYAEGGAVSDLDDFDFIQDEIQADIDAQIEEQQRSDDADERERNQAEEALRAATEQRIAAQFPQPDEMEIMNTAGYDKEPTSYPTAGRASYAGFGGDPLFSNVGGLEQPFSRDNRPMTNLGSPLSDYINNESAEGTFADSDKFNFPVTDYDITNRGFVPTNIAQPASRVTEVSPPEEVDFMFGTEDLTNRTPTPTGFGFDDDEELRDSSVMYSDMSLDELEQLSRDGDEGASQAIRDRMDDINARELDAFERDEASKGFSTRPATSMAPPRDDVFSIGSSGSSGLTSEPLGGDPFAPTRDAMGYIPPTPYDASFPTEPAVSANIEPTLAGLASSGDVKSAGFNMTFADDLLENIKKKAREAEIKRIIAEASMKPRPDESMYGAGMENQLNINRENKLAEFRDNQRKYADMIKGRSTFAFQDENFGRDSDVTDFTVEDANSGVTDFTQDDAPITFGSPDFTNYDPFDVGFNSLIDDYGNRTGFPEKDPVIPATDVPGFLDSGGSMPKAPFTPASSTNGKFINTGGFGLDEDGEIFDSSVANISKDYIKSLEKQFTTLQELGKFDNEYGGEIRTADVLARLAYDTGVTREYEDFYKTDSDGEKIYYDVNSPFSDGDSYSLESYAETLREYIDDAKAGDSEGYYTNIDFDRDGEFRDSAGYNISKDYIKSLENQYETLSGLKADSSSYDSVFNLARDSAMLGDGDGSPDDYEKDLKDFKAGGHYDGSRGDLENYAKNLRESINDFKMNKPTPADFDPEGVVAGEKALINDINSDIFSDSGMGGAIDDNAGVSEIGSGGVDFDSGGDFLGEFGGSGIDVGSGVTETDSDSGMGKALDDADKLLSTATGNTKEVIEAIEADTNDKLYYEALDGLGKGNYEEETREELIKRLRDGERNQGWVRDIVSTVSKAHPVLFLADKLMIKLTQKDMKEQADLLDGKGLKDGQTAEAVRIQKGRHKGKYVGVVIKEGDKIVEYKGHKVMSNQFDNKDPLYDYILADNFKDSTDDDSPVVDDPCPPGFVLSGGVCVPIQSVGEEEEDVVEEDTTTDDTPDTTETLDEIMARITNPSRTPSNPTETLRPITFANKGGEMKVDPLAGGAIQDSLASATQRFLNSLTG